MAGFDLPNNDLAFNSNQSIWMSTDVAILTAGLNGVGVVTDCAVTAQGSPDMTVAIAAGTIRIASGALVAVTGGNGTITAADATNPRIDLISATNAGIKTVTAGTAAASPKAPDLPAGNVGLAMVYVPANDTTIDANQITDKRVIFSGGGGIPSNAIVATNQSLAGNNSWVDLTTAGPAVTVTVSASGVVKVTLTAKCSPSADGGYGGMGFALSGANTVAATATKSLMEGSSVDRPDVRHSAVYLLTGLAAGSTTFTAKYNQFGGPGTTAWADREIIVELY